MSDPIYRNTMRPKVEKPLSIWKQYAKEINAYFEELGKEHFLIRDKKLGSLKADIIKVKP